MPSISDFEKKDSGETKWESNTEESSAPIAENQKQSATAKSTQQQPRIITAPSADSAPSHVAITTTSETQKTDEILNHLMKDIGDIAQKSNFKILIYGPPGHTKSSFVATAPNNLIYDLEDGLISAKGSPHGVASNVKALPFKSFIQTTALIEKLKESPPELDWVKVLSIDTFSELHKRALQEITEREWKRRPSLNRFVPETEHHTENNEQMIRMIRALRAVERDLIIVSHARTEEPRGKPAKTFPDFSEKLANKIEAMMDIVGYLSMKKVDDKLQPVLQVAGDEGIHCKTRVPMPAELINPTYDTLRKYWEESKNG